MATKANKNTTEKKPRLHGKRGAQFGLDFDTSFPEDMDSENDMSGIFGSQFGDKSRKKKKPQGPQKPSSHHDSSEGSE